MSIGKRVLAVFLAALTAVSLLGVTAVADETHTEHDICHPNPSIGTTGTFSAINYNVQGLPIPESETEDGKNAFEDSFVIGEILNALKYEVVAVQEDFNYDIYLRGEMTNYANCTDKYGNITHRHQSEHAGGVPLGDGLNTFSLFDLYNAERVSWEKTAGILDDGSDQLTYKGFQVNTIEVAKGYYIDVYNVHIDAYGSQDSIDARRSQFTQLAEFIKKHSVYDPDTGVYDHAVIVTGDFNASIYLEDEEYGDCLVKNLLEPCGLNDAWAVTRLDNIVEDPEDYSWYYDYADRTDITFENSYGHYDSIERFCYVGGNGIDLSCLSFTYQKICDEDGRSLSDHYAAIAEFEWEIEEKVQDIYHQHDSEDIEKPESFLIKFLKYIASLFRSLGLLLQGLSQKLGI